MRIDDILTRNRVLVTIDWDQPIQDAIQAFETPDVSSLIVTRDGGKEVAGVITAQGILLQCSRHCDGADSDESCPRTCPRLVRDLIGEAVVASPGDRLDSALTVMQEHQLQALPVVEEGKLVGSVTHAELKTALLQETSLENRFLKDYISGTPG